MVNLTQMLKFAEKFPRPRKYKGFIDTIQLRVRGGPGGMGSPKFGGIGGNGGDVILQASEDAQLINLVRKYPKKLIKGGPGENSHQRCIRGKPGENTVVTVPVGVNVINNHCQIIGELDQAGSRMVVSKGGPGGCQETGFSGMKGEDILVRLDLKLIADLGLVGFPNAGKSTLLRAITNAKPRIASYPFTTIKPNVGYIKYDDLRMISTADLPGLIEGAHKNVGMGHKFLRHCERTKMLILIADIQGFQLSHKHLSRTCLETVVLLNKELELYREFLLDKPALLVINKMDIPGAWDKFKEIEKSLHKMEETIQQFPTEIRPLKAINFRQIVPISAKTSPEDVKHLKQIIRKQLDIYAEEQQLENAETNLLEELKLQQTEYGPKLI